MAVLGCVGVKGGVSATSTAVLTAVVASEQPAGAVLVDLTGDAAPMLGVEDGPGGVVDVVRADSDPSALLVEVTPSLRLLRLGGDRLDPHRDGEKLAQMWPTLASDGAAVVVDAGCGPDSARLMSQAPLRRVLVSDTGFASLRRCAAMLDDADAVVVRSDDLSAADAAQAASVWGRDDVVAIAHDPMLAKMSEAGRVTEWADAHLAELAPLASLSAERLQPQRSL